MKHRILLLAAFVGATTCAIADDRSASEQWTVGTAGESFAPMVVLEQRSPDGIPDEYASKEVHPVLSFRCPEGGGPLTFQIDWQRFISSFSTEAGFRVDDGKVSWMKLSVDSSNNVTLGKTADAESLIDKLAGGSRLNVEIAPYSEASVFVNFDVSTFPEHLEKLTAACR